MIFEDVKPLYQKTDAGYEGLGVDVLEQIRMQARRRKVQYTSANSVKEGLNAVITGKADIACGMAINWARSTPGELHAPLRDRRNPSAHGKRHQSGRNARFAIRQNRWHSSKETSALLPFRRMAAPALAASGAAASTQALTVSVSIT